LKLLEITCFTPHACLIAQEAGADRIEFCRDYRSGGLTPSEEDIIKVRSSLHLPLHILIRPRGSNFIYTKEEKESIRQSVTFCRENKVEGIVFGALDEKNEIDTEFCKEIIDMCENMSITFHRAFDEVKDPFSSAKELIRLKVSRILTSGKSENATDGIPLIKNLYKAYGDKILIMPGGGIRSGNLKEIMEATACHEFHSSAIIDDTETTDPSEVKKLKSILPARL